MRLDAICQTCRSPLERDWDERDQMTLRSVNDAARIREALDRLARVDSGYGGDEPFFEEEVLADLLGEGAGAVQAAYSEVVARVESMLGQASGACPDCGAPAIEIFDAEGAALGLLSRPPADAALIEAFERLYGLRVAKAPAAFNTGNPYYEPGDEKAPVISEAFLYTLIGKDPARSILGALRQLVRVTGAPTRIAR